MRRRLTVVTELLLVLLSVSLLVPLIAAYAEERTQDSYAARLTDVTRFAVLAQDSLEDGGAAGLEEDLVRYREVYGGSVLVTDRRVVATAGPGMGDGERSAAAAITQALSGAGAGAPATVWPWGPSSFVVSSPVGRDAQVLGAVVLVAPTEVVRRDVGVRLAWLAAALVLLLAMVLGLVGRFVTWILRPVRVLDEAAVGLADGDLSTRVPSTTGPPELRHLVRSFNKMADHVETSQRQQRDLIADASHQLGNPLTALRLRVEDLRANPDPTQVDLALEETDRLGAIVESLLDLSTIGAQVTAAESLDVAAQVRHRCALWAPVIDGLAVDTPRHLLALVTPDLIDVVLDAVLDNAAKFAPGQDVSVHLSDHDDAIHLRVHDRGAGLEPDDVAKVGARFFRGRGHQNIVGTGLGLAIVRARVEEVGGTCDVEVPDEGGLAVTVTLPPAQPPRSPRK